MNKFVVFLIFESVVCAVNAVQTPGEGYYWRDYEGITPGDAFQGGLDKNGRPIYIGQILFENKLIPGKIYENDTKVYYEWSVKEAIGTNNIKILCTLYPEKFEWIPTKLDDVPGLTNKLLVKGGYEPGFFTYIGRVFSAGETTVGKVICKETSCLGLYITNDGTRTDYRDKFEILTYNPNNKAKNVCYCSPPLDVRFSKL